MRILPPWNHSRIGVGAGHVRRHRRPAKGSWHRRVAAVSTGALLFTGVVGAAGPALATDRGTTAGTTAGTAVGTAVSAGVSASADDTGVTRGRDWSATERYRRAAALRRALDNDIPAPARPGRARPIERVLDTRAGTEDRGGRDRSGHRGTRGGGQGTGTAPGVATGTAAPGGGTGKTLIVYDNSGPWAWLGEAYATQAANLSSRFGSWTAHPVAGYTDNELDAYTALIYIGSTYDEPLPVEFLDDVTGTGKPVLWLYGNIWQLTARDPDFAARRGFLWKQFDFSTVSEVRYRGTSLTRDTRNGSGIMDHVISDPDRAVAVAEAVRSDGSTLPWGVRSGNFTYLGEIPFAYVSHDDRYLAFADLLFDVLAPAGTAGTAERHRALVRIEDVGPDADPAELRAIADYLYSQRVPFTVAVYPRYRNPHGVDNGGRAADYTLRQRPAVVSALRYLRSRGGTLLMHGYTHQYESMLNPYDGMSGNDFEFYTAHVDANDSVIYDGPVPRDGRVWATLRMASSATEFARAGLPVPTIFEFPHYAGSATDYAVADDLFGDRYDRGLYFPGVLSGGTVDHTRLTGQFFPYAVRDVYGSAVVPENIGNVEPEAFNNHPARLPADLLASARRNLVVRDGVASFFYHPYLGTAYLKQLVEGVRELGYTFVPAATMIGG